MATCNIANALYHLGDHDACIKEHMRSLELSRKSGDEALEKKERHNVDHALELAAQSCFDKGSDALAAGKPMDALRWHEQGLAYGQRMSLDADRLRCERVASCIMGNAWQRHGDYSRAVALHKRALALSLAARDAHLARRARNNLQISMLSEADRQSSWLNMRSARVRTPLHLPAWRLPGLRPLLGTPERHPSVLEACRVPSGPPRAALKWRGFHFQPTGSRRPTALG